MYPYYINEKGELIITALKDSDATDIVLINGNVAIVDEETGELVEGEMV